jgi:hypothetical protein
MSYSMNEWNDSMPGNGNKVRGVLRPACYVMIVCCHDIISTIGLEALHFSMELTPV